MAYENKKILEIAKRIEKLSKELTSMVKKYNNKPDPTLAEAIDRKLTELSEKQAILEKLRKEKA